MLPAFLLPMLIGGGAGALMNKKDPLKGALLGGALGAGGAALPGLLGAGGATAGIAPGATAATEAAGSGLLGAEAGVNSMGYIAPEMTGIAAEQAAAPVVNMNTQAGLLDKANYAMGNTFSQGGQGARMLDVANKMAKPASTAMQAASMFKPEEQPPIQAPQIIPPTASPALGQIVQNNQQAMMNKQQLDAQKRDMRKRRIWLIGGY